MVLITSIIAVITGVSVYDYYSAKSWQQLTSPDRNDVVFENRNQKYGAYALRRDYDKRVMLILLSFISSIGISYGAFLFFRSPIVQISDDNPKYDWNIIEVPPAEKEQEKPKEEEPKEESGPKQEPTQSTKFIEPIVTDKDTPDQIPPNDTMDTTAVSTETNPNGNIGTTGGGCLDCDSTDGGSHKKTSTIETPEEFPFKEAEFPGGAEARTKFIINKTNYPEEGMIKGGKCFLRFVVGKDGEISSVNITRGVPNCPSCDKEAIRVIKLMPRWRPAETNLGRKIASYFTMTINFQPPKE